MNCALLIIGDELLAGKTRDLNGYWLSTYLPSVGMSLEQIKVIKDDKDSIKSALDELYEKVEVIFTSGGLGPTKDDITKNVLASYFGKKLISNKQSITFVTNLYAKFDREWTPERNEYHLLPEGFELLDNLNGFAPGLYYHEKGKTILSAPGVPREFSSMVENAFIPKVKALHKENSFNIEEYFSIRTRGVPEEVIFGEMCPGLWEQLSAIAKVSSLPQLLGIDIVLYFSKENKERVIDSAKQVIESTKLKDYVWQYGNLELPELIVKESIEKNITISFAESCTGGLTSSKITDISGASRVFLGSIISYANEVKIKQLGVSSATIESFGAVSEQCAKEMAIGAMKALKSDIAISYTGIAGPSGGSTAKPVGTVGIGWATKKDNSSVIENHKGSRETLKEKFCASGLFKLLELVRSH